MLGIPKIHRFISITLPFLKKPFISIIFAIFTLIITDYGVPLMVGSQYITLPVMMYQEVIGLLDISKGAVIGVVLLIPVAVAFVLDLLNQDSGNSHFASKAVKIRPDAGRDFASMLFCTVISIAVLMPVLSFVFPTFAAKYPIDMAFTFDNIIQTFRQQGGDIFLTRLR